MTQVVTESRHVNDEIVKAANLRHVVMANKTKHKTVTVGSAATPELLAEIDEAIAHLNKRFPAYLQCNRSQFVLGAIMLALKDLEAMLTMTQD